MSIPSDPSRPSDRGEGAVETCRLCGGRMVFLWRSSDTRHHSWEWIRCAKCGLAQLRVDGTDPAWRDASYSGDYYGGGYSKFTGAVQALREFSAWRRALEIDRFFKKPGRVLDIGCGEGLFLKAMKRLGWSVAGCEIAEQPARRAEELLGQAIHRGEFATMPAPARPWDVVMLWHVLEHVADPPDLLARIAAVTAGEGLMMIAVPNAASWQARLFGPHWFHLDPPRHLYSMNPDHVKLMAERTGWRMTAVHHFSLEYNPFGWAQSLLNRLGWERDAMYETLKRRTRFSEPGFAWRVLAWFLLGPSIIPAALESLARRGGTASLYLRKS